MVDGLMDEKTLVDAALSDKGVLFDVKDIMPDIEQNDYDLFGDDIPCSGDGHSSQSMSCGFMPFDISNFEDLKAKMSDLWNSMIWKTVIQPGSGSSTPGDHFVVKVKYEAFLEGNTTPYDIQTKRMRLDSNSIIFGLEVAIKSMVFDEISVFLLHPNVAYGSTGIYPIIPQNSYVLFRIEMFHFAVPSPVDFYYDNPYEIRRNMPFEEIQRVIMDEKQEGNKSYSFMKYRTALKCYERCLRVLHERLPQNHYEDILKNRMRVEIFSNMAICHLKQKDFSECVRCCKECLDVDPKCVKALYRLSKAFSGKGKAEKAVKYMRKAFELEPNNSQIGYDMIALEKEAKTVRDEERAFFRKAFGRENSAKDDVSMKELELSVHSDFRDYVVEILGQLGDEGSEDVVFGDSFSPQEKYFVYEKAKELNLETERIENSIKVLKKK